MKVGMGFDIHKLVKGRRFILGGVPIQYPKGLLGHSDGDALIHALIDALLGALGMADIGELFPDSDGRFRGISSVVMLRQVMKEISRKGYRVQNVDTVIFAEAPKLGPYRQTIQKSLARVLHSRTSQINIKAKTMEGMGPIGQKKAVGAYCVLLLKRRGK